MGLYMVNQYKGVSPKPIVVSINVDEKEIPMEVNTGAGYQLFHSLLGGHIFQTYHCRALQSS